MKPVYLTENQVVDAVREVLDEKGRDTTALDIDSPLTDLGMDSVDFAELFMSLEDRSNLRFDPGSAQTIRIVRDLLTLRPL